MKPKTPLVASQSTLADLIARAQAVADVALDCEADSFHHYEEKLCLLQLTLGSGPDRANFVVDPLAPGSGGAQQGGAPYIDLRPLLAVLAKKRLLLHAGDNDLRMVGLHWEFAAGEIFDTFVAAQYLGEPELSLSALLTRHFGVALDKSLQRANWAQRPLTTAMIEYAARDTYYLPELAALLEGRLREAGRLEWHRQACARLTAQRRLPRPMDPDAWRVKGSSDLAPEELAILRPLWRWRDGEARARDLAPFRVAGNDVLLLLSRVARKSGSATDALIAARLRSSGASLRALRAALEEGLAMPPEMWPGRDRDRGKSPRDSSSRLSRAEEARLGKLRAARDGIAAKLGLEPGLLASRGALERLASLPSVSADDLRSTAGLLPWQAAVLSDLCT